MSPIILGLIGLSLIAFAVAAYNLAKLDAELPPPPYSGNEEFPDLDEDDRAYRTETMLIGTVPVQVRRYEDGYDPIL